MSLRFGVGQRIGPFWTGVTLSPRRYFEDNPHSTNLKDSPSFLVGMFIGLSCAGTIIAVAVVLFIGFLILLL